MKKFIQLCSVLVLLHCVSFANAQHKITGTVIDSLTLQPVSFANVVLMEINKSTPLLGAATENDGAFLLSGVEPGRYKLIFSFVSYRTRIIEALVGDEDENIGTIKLSTSANQLNEVVVTAQKNMIEQKVDRLVYNPDNSISTTGGDATDVLKNVPLLAVDVNGNLYLKGNQNIKLLINDKPSSLAIVSISDALKQIPADMIKSVEVMTSPPAKYDAEGAAGVVNIILKKNSALPSLNSNGSFEVRGSKFTLNGSVRKGKMTYGGTIFQNYSYNHPGAFTNTQTTDPSNSSSTLYQQAVTNFNSFRQSYTFNWDYDINPKNYISSYIMYYHRDDNSVQNKLHTWNAAGDISLKEVATVGGANTVDANFTYVHKLNRPKQEFSLMAMHTASNSKNDFDISFVSPADLSAYSFQKNVNDYSNEELTIQTDYQTPIGKKILFETGLKNIMRNVSVQYQYFNAASDRQYVASVNPAISNNLSYSQNVKAAYVSYSWSIAENTEVKAGLRYEDTFIAAAFGNQQTITIPSYSLLVPSVNFMKQWKDVYTIKSSYNRRIQRPSVQYLNPNLTAPNSLNVTQGNPGLSPEFTDNFDVSFSARAKNFSLDLSSYFNLTQNAIQTVRKTFGRDTILTTYQNTGKLSTVGLDINSTITVSNKISFTGELNTFYSIIEGSDPIQAMNIRNEGVSHFVSLLARYKINPRVRIEFNGFNFGNTYSLQGHQAGWSIFNISVKKDLASKRGSFGVTAGNFIPGSIKMKSYYDSPYLSQQSVNEVKNLNFKIFFTYQLIRPKANGETRTRKSIKNDDLKTGVDRD